MVTAKRRYVVLSISAALIASLVLVLTLVGVASAAWGTPETAIAGVHQYANVSSLAISGGHDYVVYSCDTHLYYTDNAGGSWSAPVAVSGADNVSNYWATSIALDSLGHVHAAYSCDTGIHYVDNTGGSWAAPEDASDETGGNARLALDAGGESHIAYEYNGNIRYVSRSAGTWSSPETVNQGDSTWCSNPSFAIDGSGYAHVTFVDGNYVAMYNTNSSGSWASPPTQISESGEGGCLATTPAGAGRTLRPRSVPATRNSQSHACPSMDPARAWPSARTTRWSCGTRLSTARPGMSRRPPPTPTRATSHRW
jgi:hypothetical protein